MKALGCTFSKVGGAGRRPLLRKPTRGDRCEWVSRRAGARRQDRHDKGRVGRCAIPSGRHRGPLGVPKRREQTLGVRRSGTRRARSQMIGCAESGLTRGLGRFPLAEVTFPEKSPCGESLAAPPRLRSYSQRHAFRYFPYLVDTPAREARRDLARSVNRRRIWVCQPAAPTHLQPRPLGRSS